jgi:hypothetical protein
MKKLMILSLALAPLATGCAIQSSSSSATVSSSGGSNGSTSNGQVSAEHSSNIETYQMAASMSAQSDGTTTKVYAEVIDAATPAEVVLDEGDFFTATNGSGDPVVLVLEPSTTDSKIVYAASLPASTNAQDITIAFVRRNGQTSAPQSIVHVPAPFTLSASGPSSVQQGDAISIRATPAPTGDNVLEATGDCLATVAYGDDPNTFDDALTFDADGNATIDTSLLYFDGSESTGATCNISFYVSAVQQGTLDPAFAGGIAADWNVEGLQKRGFQATVTF